MAFQGLPPELAQVDSCRLFAGSGATGHCLVACLLVLLDFDEYNMLLPESRDTCTHLPKSVVATHCT